MFRNSLRTTSARLDVLGVVLVGVLTGLFAAGVGFGLGVASFFLAREGRFGLLALPLWAVFTLWQFMPLMLATSTVAFDFRNLLRFPLRFSAFFLLSLAYGLLDPAALASLLWLACIALGLALARPDLLPWILLVLAVFAAMNLLLSRMVFSWIERLLARRRSREALLAILLLVCLVFQLTTALGSRWEKRLKPYVLVSLPFIAQLPPGLAGRALAGVAQRQAATMAAPLALLLAYALACGLLLERRLRAQYAGEDLSEGQAPRRVATASAAFAAPCASFASRFLSAPVATVFAKEWRYLFRNSVLLLNSFLPIILVVFFAVAWSNPRRSAGFLARNPELAFPGAAAYMFLIVGQFALNALAYEGRGIQVLFLAPVRFRDVLVGKNLMFGLLLAVETALVWLVMSLLFRPPGAAVTLATLSGLVFAALVQSVVGNWLSLKFPRRFEFGRYRQRPSGITMLVAFGLQIFLIGLAAAVILFAQWSGRIWLVAAVFLALDAIMLWVYRATLDAFTRLAARQQEVLTAQLCR
jgi:ABC-2 type transport system permease protein